jgi:hypothetical protein
MRSTLCIPVCALAALVAAGAIAVGCSDSNPPATQSSTGGTDGTGGSTGEGGGEATGGDTSTGGGEATGGDQGTAGQGTGGEFVCNYPTASNPPPEDAPQCMNDEAKNDPCTEEQEGYRCYKNCGPRYSSGWKPLTCTSGVFTEISDCTWTGDDYSAFRIPETLEEIDSACPTEPPQATMPCNVDPCISCAAPNGAYKDSGGTEKSGWCTCYHGADDEDPVWTCGTAGKAWPCPGSPANPGC